MAKNEADREDIMREATALRDRIELQFPSWNDSVIIGFRRNRCGCIYFGADPVVQFNTAGAIRRGFLQGRLLKADNHSLALLNRVRVEGAVELRRHDLTDDETTAFLADVTNRLQQLRHHLAEANFEVQGAVIDGETVAQAEPLIEQVLTWLNELPDPPVIAAAPNAC